MNITHRPTTIRNSKGRTLYLRPDGMGYESSRVRRERRLKEQGK